jgi:hyperosmotically inducible periplasmic protein
MKTEKGVSRSTGRRMRPAATCAVRIGAMLAATLLIGGCAVGMLRGAAGAGGSAPASSGSASRPEARTAAQRAADDATSTSVRSKFATNAVLKPFNLLVDTHDGVVTLRGQVTKVEQRNAAQLDARSVKGVKSVQNLITVR